MRIQDAHKEQLSFKKCLVFAFYSYFGSNTKDDDV